MRRRGAEAGREAVAAVGPLVRSRWAAAGRERGDVVGAAQLLSAAAGARKAVGEPLVGAARWAALHGAPWRRRAGAGQGQGQAWTARAWGEMRRPWVRAAADGDPD